MFRDLSSGISKGRKEDFASMIQILAGKSVIIKN